MANLAAEEREFGPGCRDLEIDDKKLKALSDPPSSRGHRGILPSSESPVGPSKSNAPAGERETRSRRVPDDLFADLKADGQEGPPRPVSEHEPDDENLGEA